MLHRARTRTPLEILVVNDDGYSAAGIDAVVEGLRTLPGVHIDVVAPATNQSGGGDKTTPGGVTGFAAQTQSGYPATAVNGYPGRLGPVRPEHACTSTRTWS